MSGREFCELGIAGSGVYYSPNIFREHLIRRVFGLTSSLGATEHPREHSPFWTVPIDLTKVLGGFSFGYVLQGMYNRAYGMISRDLITDISPVKFPNKYVSIKIQRPGEIHSLHSDAGKTTYGYGDGSDLYMSSIIILNDDYGGGDVVFPDLGVRIRPSVGSMLIFPSADHEHLVEEVTSGWRYSLLQFWGKQ
jgi:hypothetical protein